MTTPEFYSSLIRMKPDLTRFAMSLTSNREKAMDLLQETYLKAMINMDKYADFTNIQAWVLAIMKNTFINNYRRNIRGNAIIDCTRDLCYIDSMHEQGSVNSETDFYYEEIEKEIEALSNDLRNPFRMHVEGYKYEEIADKLKLKIGTVKSRIFFARRKLKLALKDYKG
ncbi:MAG: RNA polymerase sigma factor [Bacteroidales bacterium]